MPSLQWIGKEAVIQHHNTVPFRLLEPVREYPADSSTGRGVLRVANTHHRVWKHGSHVTGGHANDAGHRRLVADHGQRSPGYHANHYNGHHSAEHRTSAFGEPAGCASSAANQHQHTGRAIAILGRHVDQCEPSPNDAANEPSTSAATKQTARLNR